MNEPAMPNPADLPPSTRAIYRVFDWVGANKRRIFQFATLLVVVGFLLSGFYVVKKEEEGLKTRFGKVVETSIEPGLHFCIPLIEVVHIHKVERIERHRISSRDAGSDEAGFTILSGDTNLLEVDLVVQYRIGDLKQYLYASTDPHTIVSTIVRESLVDIFGRNFIDLIFTENRSHIENLIFETTLARLEKFQIGVELIALSIVDLSPIVEAIQAFRDVNDATAERLQLISTSEKESERMIARTRGQAVALRRNAEVKAIERVAQAKSAASAFLALLESYKSDPASVAYTRYWQRMRSIFSEATLQAVNPKADSIIDINMIDSGGPFTPAGVMASVPRVKGAIPADDRPLLAGLSRTPGQGYETTESDGLLIDGGFHSRVSERDHLGTADIRSLIFDNSDIFVHRHVEASSIAQKMETEEAPVIEQPPKEAATDSPANPSKEQSQ